MISTAVRLCVCVVLACAYSAVAAVDFYENDKKGNLFTQRALDGGIVKNSRARALIGFIFLHFESLGINFGICAEVSGN